MQPIYIVGTSTAAGLASSPWKLTNWHCTGPMNIGISIAANSTSTWQIDYTVDDPTLTYPNPTLGSAVTVFSSFSGSSSAYSAFTTPVAAIRLTVNTISSVGGKVTATILQAGIG